MRFWLVFPIAMFLLSPLWLGTYGPPADWQADGGGGIPPHTSDGGGGIPPHTSDGGGGIPPHTSDGGGGIPPH